MERLIWVRFASRVAMVVVIALGWGVAVDAFAQDATPTEEVIDVEATETVLAVPAVPAGKSLAYIAESMPDVDPDEMEGMVQTPQGLAVVLALLVWMIMEALKGLVRRIASATTAEKWSISVVIGALLGTAFGLWVVPFPVWVAACAGALGAGGVSTVRFVGKAVRGVRESGGFSQIYVLVMAACVGVIMVACAGLFPNLTPQEQAVLDASQECGEALFVEGVSCVGPCRDAPDMATCVNQCGDHLLHTSFPACVSAYGVLAGPRWSKVVDTTVALLLMVYDILMPVPAVPAEPS